MRLVHRLAGSAPSYGYQEIGDIAGSADALLARTRQNDRPEFSPDHHREFLEELNPMISRLLQALENASGDPDRTHAFH
jgi:HPt (histidine-containing phosphotransfer) domain-containing protein